MQVTDPHSARLSELTECAYRLGLAFGHEAEHAEDTARQLEYFRLFDRCFFSVRVAIALELRLRRTPPVEASGARAETERPDGDLSLERERLEAAQEDDGDNDRDDARYDERDRERETERASLPVLLRTLNEVAAQAATLPGPEPAALPTLRELLAHMAPEPPPTPHKTDLRARLTTSGAAVTLERAPRPTRSPGGLAVRRATGPPRR